jgi:hypothetical protein
LVETGISTAAAWRIPEVETMGKFGEHFYTVERVIRDADEFLVEFVGEYRLELADVIACIERGERKKALVRAKQLHSRIEALEDATFERIAEYDRAHDQAEGG